MPYRSSINSILVVGAGLIGSSWTALFLAKGFNVVVSDPDKEVEKKVRAYVSEFWPNLEELGLAEGASQDNLSFEADLEKAIGSADFVIENGPEKIDFKRKLFKQMDDTAPVDVLIASSSSGIPMSDMTKDCTTAPQRCLIAHPFNPPHIIPLVELVAGDKTDPGAIDVADAFFTDMGKVCIRLKKEMPGHVANRIAAALWREVLYLVEQDVVSVEDVDKAVSWGPGLRWGVMGQALLYHLGGGRDGISHYFDQFSASLDSTWKLLKSPELNDDLKSKVAKGIEDYVKGASIASMEKQRDQVLIDLIGTRRKIGGVVGS